MRKLLSWLLKGFNYKTQVTPLSKELSEINSFDKNGEQYAKTNTSKNKRKSTRKRSKVSAVSKSKRANSSRAKNSGPKRKRGVKPIGGVRKMS